MSDAEERDGHTSDLSRRGFMLSGTAMALAANTIERDALAATLQDGRPPGLVWEANVGDPLDPRVLLVESAGVAIVGAHTLTSDTREVYAFDLETGEPLWTVASTPFNGLYTHNGVLYEHDVETLVARDPTSPDIQWAVGGRFSQPFVFAGEFAAFSGQYHPATVVDLQAETAWQIPDTALHEVVTLHEGTAVVRGEGEMAAYDVESQQERWRVSGLPTGRFTVDATGQWPLAFVESPEQTVAIGLDGGDRRWTREERLDASYVQTAAGEGVVLSAADGTLSALNPVDGSELWSNELAEESLAIYEVGGSRAFPVGDDQLWAVALDDGSVEWSVELTAAVPFVEHDAGTVYTGGETQRGHTDGGEQRWAYESAGTVPLVPAIGEETMVIAAGNTVYGFAFDGVEPTRTATLGTTAGGTDDGATGTEEPTDGSTSTPEETETPDGSGSGFGAAAGVLSILGVAELLRQRSADDES